MVSGLRLESPPPQSPPTPRAVKPSTPACPASRPTWPAAARSVPRPSPQPCAWCSQLLPRVPYILCVPLTLWGPGPAQPRTLSPQPQPSRKSVSRGWSCLWALHLCRYRWVVNPGLGLTPSAMGCDPSLEHLPLATLAVLSCSQGTLVVLSPQPRRPVKPAQWAPIQTNLTNVGAPAASGNFWSSKGQGGGQPLGVGLPCALQGDHLVGKYCCLLCPKEFSSESGVKYHILKTHAEVRLDGLALWRGRGGGRDDSSCCLCLSKLPLLRKLLVSLQSGFPGILGA